MAEVFAFASRIARDRDDAAVEGNVVLGEIERSKHRVGGDGKNRLSFDAHHHPNAGRRLFGVYELRPGRGALERE